ncbi:MAG TPA: leucine--tRNA ligase [Dehalococcoidia bacterium]|nr:leucine--tRNA ligase [Dehalococcoidia bacterium]
MTQTREPVEGRIERYVPPAVEAKWQARWEQDGLYTVRDDDPRPKYYFLTMYPYPSGDLHIGHWYAETPPDTKARYLRMRGYNVLFPYGFDAFGLPAENAAIRNQVHPFKWTMENIAHMREQAKRMGTMFDWSREVITCLPEYYKWNQWFFLQFYKRGLAYRQKAAVDWCPNCNTTLAREQVWGEDRHCERCGTPVIKRDLEQWFFRITAYAEELLDFQGIDWPERVKAMQTNWIGRSEGANITFSTDVGEPITVFTTRPDTIYGVTFMVLAPEHPLVERLTTPERKAEIDAYVEQARRQTEIERTAADRTKTGVFTGSYCVNPYSGERVPVYVGDYVLATYGTGAVMGVPAHDQRDFEFAQKYGLEIKLVIAPPDYRGEPLEQAYVDEGVMVNSGPFDGTPNEEGMDAVIAYGAERGFASKAVTYRLRDWLVSRQRYWGTPIPIIYCPKCGTVPVPENDLPVLLPEDADFLPTGESPLKYHEGFRKVKCPQCGEDAERETDTMDTFVDSSWYQYRYLSPHYDRAPFDYTNPAIKSWLPVTQYTGGIEHATMHLMYFRFFTKAMRDLGLVDFGEPALHLFNQGVILGPDGEKMSKSRGNVVNPDDYVSTYGADTFRCYLMFIGPWSEGGPYRPEGIEGLSRWLNRVWTLAQQPAPSGAPEEEAVRDLERQRHRTIRVVTEDMEAFRFNTMLARLMEFTTYLARVREAGNVGRMAWERAVETLLLLVAPAAPHIAEELWERTGRPYSIHQQAWPQWDEALAAAETFTLVVQVNGKLRDRFDVPVDISEEQAKEMALASPKVQPHVQGHQVQRVLYVPGRLVNIVVR